MKYEKIEFWKKKFHIKDILLKFCMNEINAEWLQYNENNDQ
jgi:hypothetical protein